MSRLKVGLNGFGRIGRTFARIALQRDLFDLVMINTRSSNSKVIADLLKNDYVYGNFDKELKVENNALSIDDKEIRINNSDSPTNVPWQEVNTDIVIDATGVFLTSQELKNHLKGSVKKVILTTVSKDEETAHLVLGVNDADFDFKNSDIIANCSCTTNSVAVLYKVLQDTFGIKSSFFTTVHAYTQSQTSLEDLSKLKAIDLSIIPSTTGASVGVVRTIPELSGKIKGLSLRVPVPTVSFSDVTALLEKETSVEEINNMFKEKAEGKMQKYLGYQDSPINSSELIGSTYSCVFDSNYTEVIDGNYVKLTGWYDNEWGYSSRVADLVEKLSQYI
ncbi:hypothetical protein A3F29_04685 [Candidatus Roizmanbacteria bacterium RIFCSPHIGHO2_12_FULL_33_9]|uniref:Glyceraldehyde 3-phosphate dehydrogenase NAD(P) binding domain-containing protein n=1 Tax=Candidatus Roizmanbacteria bacterium RIFCSPHIGHO2_12_FULL_33_9 TaxID=1802045 RepID=A0A1F7HKC8_9BACT|nr:MAG: hypothetical protein A3F29_04685 [Candidatus Roizmanbacteria bacterium RIFCSPHIGHO2_12_FULL_33_9]